LPPLPAKTVFTLNAKRQTHNEQTMKALISVSDKTGIAEFAAALAALGIELISTGGTAKLLQEQGLQVTEVAELTAFPEMLDGRVKTLHPKVHGGLLARRDLPAHMAALAGHGIATIDLLVVNLYPFEATVAKAGCTLEDAIENIDIGGPAMVRSAAKNWRDVAVLTDAAQYQPVLDELKTGSGKLSGKTRFALAVAAFNRIAQYDGAISDYLSAIDFEASQTSAVPVQTLFPAQSNARFIKLQDLRYGENPHQQAAFYRDLYPAPGSLAVAEQLQGKELSYNNIADADAAWECVKQWSSVPACVIVKHANPCGVALGADAREAYTKAFKTDPTSAFGGIIAFNVPVDGAAAQELVKQFIEVLMAPGFTPEALAVFKAKANVRLLQIPLKDVQADGATPWLRGQNAMEVKRVSSGLLIQTSDTLDLDPAALKVVTRKQPTEAQLQDLRFAWKVAHFVKSNAIVFCGGGMTLGVGAGQMSRVDSARIASMKAANAGLSLQGSAVASDAFFPFRDGLDVVIDQGAACVIQPGGSMRDQEVIDAANERGVAMVFTGTRHFRH
jgi:phosphoribosylaminoimidazolecarboxamide formyltransferase/IMP cyclohydrolase